MLWKVQMLFILKYVDSLSRILIEVRKRGGTHIAEQIGTVDSFLNPLYWMARRLRRQMLLVGSTISSNDWASSNDRQVFNTNGTLANC